MAADLVTKKARYEKVRAEVVAWASPTQAHDELRKFMLEQIDLCYQTDEEPFRSTPLATPDEYVANMLAHAARDVVYHSEEHAKELARCADANAWLEALDRSLPRP
jgi:hypothetical protein